jgi:hypothetical protein
MRCPQCGSEYEPTHRLPGLWQWCSWACRRQMIRELRDLSMTVSMWSDALEMPEVVRARDELGQRYLDAVFAPRPDPPEPPLPPEADDESDLPVYVVF